ncbi:MAG: helix-turn-helix transcriptional regulator [Phycicoccus sp.]|nr:helix-turn-helix transcriptional regulator [Phycicoccus sp.]NMM35393.1 helix-turn-helix transcriptional regulator [Phycicoccus sp.]
MAECYSDSVDSDSSFWLAGAVRLPTGDQHSRRLLAFGARVRELRVAAGMSQEDLAERASLHRTYIGSVERGERNLAIGNCYALADALNVPLREMLGD